MFGMLSQKLYRMTPQPISTPVLGVDIGNVIIDFRHVDTTDPDLMENRYSSIPPADGAVEALSTLHEGFGGRVYLVSKCSEWAAEKIRQWLMDNTFFERTGIAPDNVRFCRERPEKRDICRQLHVTHFVDDRLENLGYLAHDVEHRFLFQPDNEEVEQFRDHASGVTVVETWEQAAQAITNTM